MNVEAFKKKTYKGFDGEFDENDEIGYKYHFYFKTFYEQYYCVVMYTLQEIDSSKWVPITKGRIEIYQLNKLPPMQYVISEPTTEYINLNDYQHSKTITNSYLDFSKYGNNKSSPTGYVVVNFNKFRNIEGSSDAVKTIESNVSGVIYDFYCGEEKMDEVVQDADNILNNILEDSDSIEWQHQCLIRKQGLYGSNSSNEQISK